MPEICNVSPLPSMVMLLVMAGRALGPYQFWFCTVFLVVMVVLLTGDVKVIVLPAGKLMMYDATGVLSAALIASRSVTLAPSVETVTLAGLSMPPLGSLTLRETVIAPGTMVLVPFPIWKMPPAMKPALPLICAVLLFLPFSESFTTSRPPLFWPMLLSVRARVAVVAPPLVMVLP